jgi:hypothetical protein
VWWFLWKVIWGWQKHLAPAGNDNSRLPPFKFVKSCSGKSNMSSLASVLAPNPVCNETKPSIDVVCVSSLNDLRNHMQKTYVVDHSSTRLGTIQG